MHDSDNRSKSRRFFSLDCFFSRRLILFSIISSGLSSFSEIYWPCCSTFISPINWRCKFNLSCCYSRSFSSSISSPKSFTTNDDCASDCSLIYSICSPTWACFIFFRFVDVRKSLSSLFDGISWLLVFVEHVKFLSINWSMFSSVTTSVNLFKFITFFA